MVQLSIFDTDGYPIQKRGITDYPGLYFVGLPWLHNARSGLLWGVAQDAAHITSVIERETLQRLERKITKQTIADSKMNKECAGRVAPGRANAEASVCSSATLAENAR